MNATASYPKEELKADCSDSNPKILLGNSASRNYKEGNNREVSTTETYVLRRDSEIAR